MQAAKKLLIIEDDHNISDIITVNATMAGYECDAAYDGEAGLKKACSGEYDLILLDLMLPKINGFEICKRLRSENISTPIIMLTARAEEGDKVLGLELGADDYVIKPFGVKELLARIKANIRRSESDAPSASGSESSQKNDGIIQIRSLIIDENKCSVEKNGEVIDLSKIEYELLLFLAKNPGRFFSREDLLTNVWKYENFYGEPRTVDVAIVRLRKKIKDDPAHNQIIQTKRGMGYRLLYE